MKYRNWSLTEKLEILSESEQYGVVETCRKHSVSTGTFYNWKKKFDYKGQEGLKIKYETKTKEHREVEEENRLLRKVLSDKEIELEVQRELLKKKFGTCDPRKI